jgi:hypothetical protein
MAEMPGMDHRPRHVPEAGGAGYHGHLLVTNLLFVADVRAFSSVG